MKKYYIGLLVIGFITLCLAGYIGILGVQTRQDIETEKKAMRIADQLNAYTDRNATLPKDLATAGVGDVPKTVSYQKLTAETYKFCVNYKQSKGYASTDITSTITNAATSKLYGFSGDIAPDYQSTYLYVGSSHEKGENCQTIKPYMYSSSYNSSAASEPYKICETAYDYWWSFLKVTSVTPRSGNTNAVLYTDDSTNRSVELDAGVKVFDHDCKAIALSDLHAGDFVDVYFHPFGSPATAIVKEF